MSNSKKPPLAAIEQPRCPKCHAKMRLARIAPGVAGFEIRSFECPHCEHDIVQRVATDPLVSAEGWLSGELKPPK
jgi:ribosomal protein L37AE/L43A